MNQEFFEAMAAVAAMFGGAFCLKYWIWGRGPILRRREFAGDGLVGQRLADLEERLEDSAEVIAQQSERIADLEERLDFTERLLTRDERRQLDEPRAVTPV